MHPEAPPTSMLGKSLTLLEILADNGTPMSLKELVQATGLPKSSVHRQLAALVDEHLVQYDRSSRSYHIGYRFMSLAFRMWQNLDLRRAATEKMRELSEEVGENTHLAVLDGNEIVYIDRIEYHQIMDIHSAVGNRAPIHCVSLGKAMVAYQEPRRISELVASTDFVQIAENTVTDPDLYLKQLDDVRRRGFADADREHQSHLRAIAAPIRDFRNEVIAAVSITVPTFRMDHDKLLTWGPRLVDITQEISRSLGWVG